MQNKDYKIEMMNKCGVIVMILFWGIGYEADAQIWTKEDSIRLANILSGKDSLRLKPEFKQSIKNGTFINAEPMGKMSISHTNLPITKDFSEYIKLDRQALVEAEHSTIKNAPDFKKLTPQAAMRIPAEQVLPDEMLINPKAFAIPSSLIEAAKVRTALVAFDANHLLSYMLSPSYRRKLKNSKRTTYLEYNQLPTVEVQRKQKSFREAHPELVLDGDSIK